MTDCDSVDRSSILRSCPFKKNEAMTDRLKCSTVNRMSFYSGRFDSCSPQPRGSLKNQMLGYSQEARHRSLAPASKVRFLLPQNGSLDKDFIRRYCTLRLWRANFCCIRLFTRSVPCSFRRIRLFTRSVLCSFSRMVLKAGSFCTPLILFNKSQRHRNSVLSVRSFLCSHWNCAQYFYPP